LIFVFVFAGTAAAAGTYNQSVPADLGTASQNFCNLCFVCGRGRIAGGQFCLALNKRARKVRATRLAACAAVCAGKKLQYGFCLGILFYSKFFIDDDDDNGKYKSSPVRISTGSEIHCFS
jgi:hypothetical protein